MSPIGAKSRGYTACMCIMCRHHHEKKDSRAWKRAEKQRVKQQIHKDQDEQ